MGPSLGAKDMKVLYSVLFLLATLIIGIPPQRAAAPCGTIGSFYAYGYNDETYSKYGVYSTQIITDSTICGSIEGSVVANYITIVWPATGDFIATGFYKGRAPDGTWTGAAKHYYWDKQTYGAYTFSDISSGTGKIPNNNDNIRFRLQGSLNTNEKMWYIWIERLGDYTILISRIPHSADFGPTSQTYMESHNNVNVGSAQFDSLENLQQTSPTGWTWVFWAASHGVRSPNDASNPYCYRKNSETSYSMYTSSTGCP